MRMGQGVRTGLGYGGIICVLRTQFSSFFFFFFLKICRRKFCRLLFGSKSVKLDRLPYLGHCIHKHSFRFSFLVFRVPDSLECICHTRQSNENLRTSFSASPFNLMKA